MGELHSIRRGDHLSRVAAQRGFRSYQPLWDHPANLTLRKERGSPHILADGDLVAIPDLNLREVDRGTDARHRFIAELHPLVIRLDLRQWDGRVVEAKPTEALLDGKAGPFTTPKPGSIEVPVGPNVARVTLKLPDREVSVRLGFLQPAKTIGGVRERLNNLGYFAGDVDDPKNLDFRSAVEEFQCDQKLSVDGVVGPATRARLVKAYGC